MKKRERLIKQLGVTDQDIKEVMVAAWAVWSDVAYDLLQAVAEEKGKDINAVTVPRSVVIEVVLDADRLRERLLTRDRTTRLSPAGQAMIDKQYEVGPARDLLALLMKETFTYRTYGM